MCNKVFIPNKTSHNYTDAERFGELIALTTGNLDLSNTSKMYRAMERIMADSKPTDHILVSGASITNSIACSMFTAKHNCLNLLIFRRNGKYIERNLTF